MSLSCPRCTQPMTAHVTATATLQGCLACGGIFLDRESRNRVVTAKCSETAAASDLAAAHARHSHRGGRATCPMCRAVMHTTRVAGNVELDVCDQHGAWFDKHELRQFIDALDVQRPKRAGKKTAVAAAGVAVAAAAASDGGGVDIEDVVDGAEVGFEVIGLLADLLGALAD